MKYRSSMLRLLISVASVGFIGTLPSLIGSLQAQDTGGILYTKEVGGNRDIYMIQPDGSGDSALTTSDAEESQPAWSPDGQKIAYVAAVDTGYEIFVMDAAGRNPEKITDSNSVAREPAWSPDGEKLVFILGSGGTSELNMINSDGDGAAVRLTQDEFEDYKPAFTPDGESIVYVSIREDGYPILHKLEVNTGISEPLLPDEFDEQSAPSFSPAGDKMAYVVIRYGADGPSSELLIADVDGQNAEVITEIKEEGAFVISTTWSPDGNSIAYTIKIKQAQQIRVIAIDGSTTSNLTSDSDVSFDAAWSTPQVSGSISYNPGGPPDPDAPAETRGLIGRVKSERLNIRIRPDEESHMVALLYTGEEVRILAREQRGRWYLVDIGVLGWAPASDLRTFDDMSQLEVWDMEDPLPDSQFYQTINCPGARGPNFLAGDRFIVPFGDGPTSIYDEPNRIPKLGRVMEGDGGTVIAGPFCTGGQKGNLFWWYVEADNGVNGYMAEGYPSEPIPWMEPE